MSFEIITTTDKDKRDQLFQDLRQNGNELERQVVKFSSNESVGINDSNEYSARIVRYSKNGRVQLRHIFRSIWSVAYPRS